jgi:prepilin signal peptidase PulO-like enzyme (type II secretory pathway)
LIYLAAGIGFFLGHLVHLIFDRFYTGERLLAPLHECSACRTPVRTRALLPYTTVIVCRGRCPNCGARLPWRAVILPAGGAGLFAASYLVFDDFGQGVLGGFFATVFLTLTLTDLERHLLPNKIIYPSIILAIALCWAWPGGFELRLFGGGVAIGLAALMFAFSLLFGAGAFGVGDVKMIVLIGFVVGFPAVVFALFLGTIVAGLVAAVLVVTRIRSLRDYIPHGPFLALGAVAALFASA